MIYFNEPVITGSELGYIQQAISSKKLSGNNFFTKKCQSFLENRYDVPKVLLTTSCTDALEMTALLIDIKPGDEVIMPSYTFVSTANAYALRGAKIKFVDSLANHPNMDTSLLENLITSKTKAIVVVHYAGHAVNMEDVLELATKFDLKVVEDAAQAIESTFTFKNGQIKQLGTIGDFGTFSFHETKNINSGEGGALLINNSNYSERAEIIWEKGTNRASFSRGEINKYGWVDLGSSFLPSELNAAFLFAQLENIEQISAKRRSNHEEYERQFTVLGLNNVLDLPRSQKFSSENGHIFYFFCANREERNLLINFLKEKGVTAVFHYLALHHSEYFKQEYEGHFVMSNAINFENCLLRLPLYNNLTKEEVAYICISIKEFYDKL